MAYGRAYQIDEYRVLRRIIGDNGDKFDRKVEKKYIKEYCKGNKEWYYEILSNIAYKLPRRGKVDSLHNLLRFVDAIAEGDRLKEAYIQNPELVKRTFSQCLISQYSIEYKDVEERMAIIKYEEKARANISKNSIDAKSKFEYEINR